PDRFCGASSPRGTSRVGAPLRAPLVDLSLLGAALRAETRRVVGVAGGVGQAGVALVAAVHQLCEALASGLGAALLHDELAHRGQHGAVAGEQHVGDPLLDLPGAGAAALLAPLAAAVEPGLALAVDD